MFIVKWLSYSDVNKIEKKKIKYKTGSFLFFLFLNNFWLMSNLIRFNL